MLKNKIICARLSMSCLNRLGSKLFERPSYLMELLNNTSFVPCAQLHGELNLSLNQAYYKLIKAD